MIKNDLELDIEKNTLVNHEHNDVVALGTGLTVLRFSTVIAPHATLLAGVSVGFPTDTPATVRLGARAPSLVKVKQLAGPWRARRDTV